MREWGEFVPALNDGCMCLTPFCDEEEEEEAVKKRSREEALDGEEEEERCATSVAAKTLCKPYDQVYEYDQCACMGSLHWSTDSGIVVCNGIPRTCT